MKFSGGEYGGFILSNGVAELFNENGELVTSLNVSIEGELYLIDGHYYTNEGNYFGIILV